MASQCPSTANKTAKRHFKFTKDAIRGISHPDIRRLARRGGVKRISATVYNDIRAALKQRLELILRRIVAVVEHAERRTVSVQDVVFVMAGLGNPIYGFDMDGAEFGKGKEEE
jgi:histone H4